jgi:hypothetical protein
MGANLGHQLSQIRAIILLGGLLLDIMSQFLTLMAQIQASRLVYTFF